MSSITFEKAKPPDITVPDFTSILPRSRARTRSQTRADLAKAAKSLPFEPEKGYDKAKLYEEYRSGKVNQSNIKAFKIRARRVLAQ